MIANELTAKLHEIRLESTEFLIQHGASWPVDFDSLALPKKHKILLTDDSKQLQRFGLSSSNWLQQKLHSTLVNDDANVFTHFGQSGSTPITSAKALISLCRWHQHDAHSLISAYHDCLSVDGFMMGACFGPNTLRELRELWLEIGASIEPDAIPDMHDAGDLIQQAGFNDVVVDTNHHRIAYESAELLLNDLRQLGELRSGSFAGLRTPRQWQHFKQKLDAKLHASPYLSIEVVYFHGWKVVDGRPKQQQIGGAISVPINITKRTERTERKS